MVKKKTVKRAPGKLEKIPVAAANANCGCGCGCCGGKKKIFLCLLKTLLNIALIAIVSALVCRFMCGRHMMKKGLMLKEPLIFRDGCVDLSDVKCPERLKELAALDVNGDGCISKDEVAARLGPDGAGCQQPQLQNRPRRYKQKPAQVI